MQALYLLALEPIAETVGDFNSYGFRPKRSTADAIEMCRLALCRKTSAAWVLEGDIRGCFDNISHEWMLRHVPTDKVMLRKWLKAGFVENRILFPTEAGTPQGGIISPVLANLTLDGLEQLLHEKFKIKILNGQRFHPKVNLVRYADDFIITGATKELLENEVKPLVEQFLRDRGLQLSPEKTCVTHIEQGFDFLGMHVRKYDGKLLIKPSKKNLHAFLEKVPATIRRNQAVEQRYLIKLLNPVIRGWTNYHRHITAAQAFRKAEMVIWQRLWYWAKRRHSDQSVNWIAKRYWHRLGKKRRTFAADSGERTPDGKPKLFQLVDPTEIRIRRYVKVKSEANPFDPRWREYFEDRAFFKRMGIHRHEAGIKPS